MHSPKPNPFSYKGGRIENTNEQETLEHKVMRWIDFIFRHIRKFMLLYALCNADAKTLKEIIGIFMH